MTAGACVAAEGSVDMSTEFGKHLADAANELRTGPFLGMRAVTMLSLDDLRAGADRQRREANQRRHLADFLEANGFKEISAHEAAKLAKDMCDDD